MKKVIAILCTLLLNYTAIQAGEKQCIKANDYLEDAILNFEKAYRTDHSRDLRAFTVKARKSLIKGMNLLKRCGCEDALSAALDGAIETKKVIKAMDFETALYRLSVARNYTEESRIYLDDCLLQLKYEGKEIEIKLEQENGQIEI
ncbi:hypothetical protein [Myroides injenensis]|uniref:hypothetical protein n=1 Tax=Myroides injenensis TaxID=1183151 RepID=UPI00226D6D25|nr:hypothetical protein [Myroides injenensis]